MKMIINNEEIDLQEAFDYILNGFYQAQKHLDYGGYDDDDDEAYYIATHYENAIYEMFREYKRLKSLEEKGE